MDKEIEKSIDYFLSLAKSSNYYAQSSSCHGVDNASYYMQKSIANSLLAIAYMLRYGKDDETE